MNNKLLYGKNDPVSDSFQAYLVKDAVFTNNEEYPIIPISFVSTEIPQRILPFNKAITSREDLSDAFICTYASDASFERIRRNPQRYIDFFSKTAGIIGFDYSIHADMPLIKQKSQINDNLSLTYYYGAAGVKVIPNLRCGVDELLPEFLNAIPSQSLVAIGTHGFYKYKYERYEWYCFLEKVIEEIEPSGIIVYGKLDDPLYDSFKSRIPFYFYTPWIYEDKKRRNEKNGD